MLGIYACDVDRIAVVGNAVNDCMIIPGRFGCSGYFGIKVWILELITDKINIKLYRKKES